MVGELQFNLIDSSVHVWLAELTLSSARMSAFESILSADERQRADRFRFAKDRLRYVSARGQLRELLSLYLKEDSHKIQFSYSHFGKPMLSAPFSRSKIQFNTSHSGSLALYAVTRISRIGIDIEAVRPDFATEEVAKRFFSPGEVESLFRLPPAVRARAFFDCWARKEAYIKAKGMGLSIPLDSFDVAFEPGRAAALLRSSDVNEDPENWSIRGLDVGPEYAAAVAVDIAEYDLTVQRFPAAGI